MWSFNSLDSRWLKSLGCYRSSWPNCPCSLASLSSPVSLKAESQKPDFLKKAYCLFCNSFGLFHVICSSGRGMNITGLNGVHPWTSHDTSPVSWVKNFSLCFLVVLHNGEQLCGGSMPKAIYVMWREKLVKTWGLRVFINVKVIKAHPLTGRGWGWKGVIFRCQAPFGEIFFQNGSLAYL